MKMAYRYGKCSTSVCNLCTIILFSCLKVVGEEYLAYHLGFRNQDRQYSTSGKFLFVHNLEKGYCNFDKMSAKHLVVFLLKQVQCNGTWMEMQEMKYSKPSREQVRIKLFRSSRFAEPVPYHVRFCFRE